ncbi:MAG: mechanosensitive ion channel family protein [Acutalibacteraceae bacterium]|jgi:small conductance mechanosensitive channel
MDIISSTYMPFILNKLIPAVLTFFIGWLLAGKLTVIIKNAMIKSSVDESIISFSNSVLKVTFRSIVILMVITCFGVNISSIIAAVGATFITIGLAVKDNLSNVTSGIIIIVNKPFKIGDSLETSNVKGKVTKIEMLYTTLVTQDNKEIVVPNSKLTADYIINSSANKCRRLDVTLPIKKEAKFSDIQPILDKIIKTDRNVLSKPEPVVAISSFNDETINIAIKVWCESEKYDYLSKNLHEKIKIELENNNISF